MSATLPASHHTPRQVLHEQVKRYRQRAAEAEAAAAAAERISAASRAESDRLRGALSRCQVQPGELLQEREYRGQLQEK